MNSESVRIAVDIGGTFTDVVLETSDARFSCKVLTNLIAPEKAVMNGIHEILAASGISPGQITCFIHGTTLATNALIERKGAKTALLTTEGLSDLLEMGYEKRFDHYDLNIRNPAPLVDRCARYPIPERMASDGQILLPLSRDAVISAARLIQTDHVESVAIGFINSYVNPEHEQQAREILREELGAHIPISISSEISPEIREFERISTTCANAYVQPLMGSYLRRLESLLESEGITSPILMMASSGGLMSLDSAVKYPIRLVESGPAGGAILATYLSKNLDLPNIVAFDLGGTTAKICLIDSDGPQTARRFEVARSYRNLKGSGMPIRIPVIELVEIGAGGGSLARVDSLSRITVGPDSAGSDPGPVSYGRGGTEPTVTDANLVLGRLNAELFAGGKIRLDHEAAHAALATAVGDRLGIDSTLSAAGVSEILEENMASACRVHAIERGKNIRDFVMVSFGGGAPIHAARLAEKLGVRKIVVPAGAGVGSAVGFLRAPISFEVVRSSHDLVSNCDLSRIVDRLDEMYRDAYSVIRSAATGDSLRLRRFVEIRYVGQGHELRIPLPDGAPTRQTMETLRREFEVEYERQYGIEALTLECEIISWSLTLTTETFFQSPPFHRSPDQSRISAKTQESWDISSNGYLKYRLLDRSVVSTAEEIEGPALICEEQTTTVVPLNWTATCDAWGNLLLQRNESQQLSMVRGYGNEH